MGAAVQAHRVETKLTKSGTLTIDDLPFQAGDSVEVIVLTRNELKTDEIEFPLRGLPVRYDSPFEPAVPPEDWNAAQ